MNKKQLNCNTALRNWKWNFKTASNRPRIIKSKEVTDHKKQSCNLKTIMSWKKRSLSKRTSKKKKSTKRNFKKQSNNTKKKSKKKPAIWKKSMSSSSKNTWPLKWNPKTPSPCCSINLILKSKHMKVSKLNTLNRKSSTKKKKSNLYKRMSSLLTHSMMKSKLCRRELMMSSRKNPESKNKS